jgi:pimeloyl-ACP methyl ester carboxylesterase
MAGQRVSAQDRLYLLAALPTLIVWGESDRTIPLEHGRGAHAAAPGTRFETLPGSGHFPNLERPTELAAVLRDFLQSTVPARLTASGWRDLLGARPGTKLR